MRDVTVSLQFPVEINGQVVSELTMRRPRVKDSLIHEKQFPGERRGSLESDIAMFARLCDMAPKDLENLDMSDVVNLQGAFRGFFSSTDDYSEGPV